jgi:hypothetical protein
MKKDIVVTRLRFPLWICHIPALLPGVLPVDGRLSHLANKNSQIRGKSAESQLLLGVRIG